MHVEKLVQYLSKYVQDKVNKHRKVIVKTPITPESTQITKEIYEIVNSFIGDIDGSQSEVGDGEYNVVILVNKWIMPPHADLVCPRCKEKVADLEGFMDTWFASQVKNGGETVSVGKRCEKCKAMTRYSLKV
jgi:hypothetical protein